MSLPTITPFITPPDRATEGSDYGAALAGWITAMNASVASFNAYITAVQSQTPAAIGAFPLDTVEVPISAATTLTASAFGKMHVIWGGVSDFTIGLPPTASSAGKIIGFRVNTYHDKIVTIDANASELIDGALTRAMWTGESAILFCTGAEWCKIAGKSIPMVCRLDGPSGQTLASLAYTSLVLSTVQIDRGLMADVANNRIITRRPGHYSVQGQLSVAGGSATARLGVQILVNGGPLVHGSNDYCLYGTTSTPAYTLSFPAFSQISMKGYHENASAITTGTYTTFLHVEEIPSW